MVATAKVKNAENAAKLSNDDIVYPEKNAVPGDGGDINPLKAIKGIFDWLRGADDVEKQNQFNANQAQLNRDWQEKMSNTAYQRGYTDLLAAGLNPNLAGGSGGASTPTGAQANSAGLPESPGNAILNAATAGMNAANGLKAYEESKWIEPKTKEEIANLTANTAKIQGETTKLGAETQLVGKQFNLLTLQEQRETIQYATEWERARTEKQKAEIENAFYSTKMGQMAKAFGMGAESILPILGPIGRFTK